jgi:[NiFe] hydrogenase diaphorase moiety large subunit
MGTEASSGTKLLSICGDCARPGIYEIKLGTPLSEILSLAGATDVQAVLMGGAAGGFVPPGDFGKPICFSGVYSVSGAVVVFNQQRNLLDAVAYYMEFFCHESCGYCTPCRVGNELLKSCIDRIRAGDGTAEDKEYMLSLAGVMKKASRCGLGQTSPNPILSTLTSFPELYEPRLKIEKFKFNLKRATEEASAIAGHTSLHVKEERMQ